MASKVDWTHRPGTTGEMWNLVTGCTKRSEGCEHCYALKHSWRLAHNPNPIVSERYKDTVIKTSKGLRWSGRLKLHYDLLAKPYHWRKPRTIFVCGMSDLFHPDVPPDLIANVLDVAAINRQHTYILLTKRARTMEDELTYYYYERGMREPLPNVWAMVTAENQARLDERAPALLRTPASIRGLSLEPLLGEVDVAPYLHGLNGIFMGGESGKDARCSHPDWFRKVRDACLLAGIPLFFKQWGTYAPADTGDELPECVLNVPVLHSMGWPPMAKLGKKRAGWLLDGKEWREWPR